jgi:hypothetical protein
MLTSRLKSSIDINNTLVQMNATAQRQTNCSSYIIDKNNTDATNQQHTDNSNYNYFAYGVNYCFTFGEQQSQVVN